MSLELQGGFLTTGPFQGNPLTTLSLTFQSSGAVKGNTGPGVRKHAVRQIMAHGFSLFICKMGKLFTEGCLDSKSMMQV